MKRLPLLNGRIALNLLAKDAANAREVWEATEGHVLVGVMLADFPTIEGAVAKIRSLQEVVPVLSVGLGAGDPNQWQRVADTALLTDPGHINQVFPAAAYTVGALRARGLEQNVVNALIGPGSAPGKVIISTGPRSQAAPAAEVSCETAAAMLADVGVESVKFFPIKGDARLADVAAMARAAAQAGMPVFEPTGGITVKNVAKVVETCLEAGARIVIPHIYTAIVDPATGRTRPEEAAALLAEVRRVVG
jgi:2-dehydro-3-deoxy-phosphogluconate aldolase